MPKVSSKTDEAAICFQGLVCLSSLQDDQRSPPTISSLKRHLNIWHEACPAGSLCVKIYKKHKVALSSFAV